MINAVKFMAMGEQFAPIDFMTALDEQQPHPIVGKLTPRELRMLDSPYGRQIKQRNSPRSGYH